MPSRQNLIYLLFQSNNAWIQHWVPLKKSLAETKNPFSTLIPSLTVPLLWRKQKAALQSKFLWSLQRTQPVRFRPTSLSVKTIKTQQWLWLAPRRMAPPPAPSRRQWQRPCLPPSPRSLCSVRIRRIPSVSHITNCLTVTSTKYLLQLLNRSQVHRHQVSWSQFPPYPPQCLPLAPPQFSRLPPRLQLQRR